jgi:hypothetical protein
MMGEWESSAILAQIIKTSIREDISNFLVVLVCAMIACGVATNALYSHIDCEHGCYLQQGNWGEWSFFRYIAAEFGWPVVGVSTQDLDVAGTNVGERGVWAALLMLVQGTLVLLIMLNLLIA